jgi:hypothetical protein
MVFTRDILLATRLERASQSGCDGSSPAPPPSPSSSPGIQFTDKQNPGSRPWITPRLFTPGRWELGFPSLILDFLFCYLPIIQSRHSIHRQTKHLSRTWIFTRFPPWVYRTWEFLFVILDFCSVTHHSVQTLNSQHNQTKSWVYTQDYPQIFHPRPMGPWVSSPILVFCYAIHYG